MSQNDLDMPETGAVRTVGQAEGGDLRRTDRLVQLAAALASNPRASLPDALRGEAETVSASRFLNHADRLPEQIVMPHAVHTRREAARREPVVMVGEREHPRPRLLSPPPARSRAPGAGTARPGLVRSEGAGQGCSEGRTVGMWVPTERCPAARPGKGNQGAAQRARTRVAGVGTERARQRASSAHQPMDRRGRPGLRSLPVLASLSGTGRRLHDPRRAGSGGGRGRGRRGWCS